LDKLKKYCLDENQLENIENIILVQEKSNKFMENNYNIIDVLRKFDSISINFIEFFNLMPKILVITITTKKI
jgi:hypothetical protein